MFNRKYYIYIITNKRNTVLYIGVTSDLFRRVHEHKNKSITGFSSKYNLDKLVYFEEHNDIKEAIFREKQLKGGSRRNKEKLVEGLNKNWNDLSWGWYE